MPRGSDDQDRPMTNPQRNRKVSPRIWLSLAFLFVVMAPFPAATADDDLARTWAAALVFLPMIADGQGQRLESIDPAALTAAARTSPVMVHAHGCAGIDEVSTHVGRALASRGWLVVQPDSFARRHKPQSCDPLRNTGGLHRAVLGWRRAEIAHALDRLAELGAADSRQVVLMGFSEGAIAVATFTGRPVAARIIEGWTCHAGWPEYRGLAAAPNEPVLSLAGANDPWFTDPAPRGDCGAFMGQRQDSQSIVFDRPSPLHSQHWLSHDHRALGAILDFLARLRP